MGTAIEMSKPPRSQAVVGRQKPLACGVLPCELAGMVSQMVIRSNSAVAGGQMLLVAHQLVTPGMPII
jgi:hypothetical protein